MFGCFHGGVGHKMNIRDQGDIHFCLMNLFSNLTKSFSCTDIGGRDTNDFTPCFRQFYTLTGSRLNIQSICGGHRLNPDGVIATQFDIPDGNHAGFSANRLEARGAVGGRHTSK